MTKTPLMNAAALHASLFISPVILSHEKNGLITPAAAIEVTADEYEGSTAQNAPLMSCAKAAATELKLSASVGEPLIATTPVKTGMTASI